MAWATIDSREASRLPAVCMKCGERAAMEKVKTFSWCPPWVLVIIVLALLPGAIVAMILTRRLTVHVPLCAEHRGHWSWRAWFTGLTAMFLGVLAVGSFIFVGQHPQGPGADLAGFVCFGSLAVACIWLIAVAILYHTAIRPTQITERTITLTNLSQDFVDALEDKRATELDDDRSRRRRRRAVEEDEEEEVEPPKRARKSEEIQDRESRRRAPRDADD